MWGLGFQNSEEDEEECISAGSWASSLSSRIDRDSRCSSSSSLDSLAFPWKTETEDVKTSLGSVQVTIWGSRDKPGLVTYHDIALNHMTCFQGIFLCSDIASLLLSNFCVYHIDVPGHEDDALGLNSLEAGMSAEDLMEQAAEVIIHYKLRQVVCMGVSAGAHILTSLAIRYPSLVSALILISPICRAATWTEWMSDKMTANVLSFYGMTKAIKESMLLRYFSSEQNGYEGPATDAFHAFKQELDDRSPQSVSNYIQAMQSRQDLSPLLRKVSCPVLIVVGDQSPLKQESHHMYSMLKSPMACLVEVEACGSLVTEERPHMLQNPLEHFLHGLGYGRCSKFTLYESRSPRSPLSAYISPDEFSPKACGLNLKPIKTRPHV